MCRHPVFEIRAYTSVYVTLSSDLQLNRESARVLDHMAHMIRERGYPPHDPVVDLVLARTKALRRHLPSRRQKRGLFNFTGKTGSAIFGIPSASAISALEDANKKLATAISGVIPTQNTTS